MSKPMVAKTPSDLWSQPPAALLDHELLQEKATALGRFGRGLEAALHALAAFDAAHPQFSSASGEERRARAVLVAEAARILWYLVVQREACGMRDSRAVMKDYKVPAEVQNAMGADPHRRGQFR